MSTTRDGLLRQIRDGVGNGSGSDVVNEFITALTPVWSLPEPAVVNTTADDILPGNDNRKAVFICNLSDTAKIYLCTGRVASLAMATYIIQPNRSISIDLDLATKQISAIATEDVNITYMIGT